MLNRYSIRSPIDIWMAYGRDPQKIADAMQLGVLRPEEGVLAVMEGKRASQPASQLPQGTVAQEVMGGAPAPQPPGLPAVGGLGATPQAAPPMAPQMPAPPMGGAPMSPPVGMAEGGIVGIDIPDTMFDESSNGGFDEGYAGGGLVAFADGGNGMTDQEYLDYIRRKESRGRDYDAQGRALRSPAGALYAMQVLPSTARDPGYGVNPISAETPDEYNRVGSDLALALRNKFGDVGGAMAYNWGPGNYQKWLEAGSPAERVPEETRNYVAELGGLRATPAVREADTGTAAGRLSSLEDVLAAVQGINRKSDEEVAAEDRLRARLEKRASNEDYESQRKADMWQTLAEIGFNMASSKSPYVLQAIGEAASMAMPGARADKKDRKAAQDRAVEGLMELGARNRKEAMDGLRVAIPIWQAGMDAEQFDKQMDAKAAELEIMRQYREDSIAIDRYKAEHPRSTTTEYMVDQYVAEFGGTPMNALKQLKDLGLIGGQSGSGGGASLEELVKTGQGGGAGVGTGGFTVTRE